MIQEIDEALRGIVRDEALRSSDVEVVFDAPTKDWAARRNAPTVNVFLYDIREDLRRRTRGVLNDFDGHGRVVSRSLPPKYFTLSYLLSAWTQRPEDEHRLLSLLLESLLRHECIPEELLGDGLATLGLPVELGLSLPPPEDRSFADVWSALGGELKPSLDVVVTVPVQPARRFDVGPPVTEGPRLRLQDTVDGTVDDVRQEHVPPERREPAAAPRPRAGGRAPRARRRGS